MFTIPTLALEAFGQVFVSPTPAPTVILQTTPVIQAGGAAPGQWLLDLMTKFPKLSILLFIVGGLRLTLKPLFAFMHQFFEGWGLVAWDQAETNIESSKFMKVLYFILDYLGSVKMPVADTSNTLQPPKI